MGSGGGVGSGWGRACAGEGCSCSAGQQGTALPSRLRRSPVHTTPKVCLLLLCLPHSQVLSSLVSEAAAAAAEQQASLHRGLALQLQMDANLTALEVGEQQTLQKAFRGLQTRPCRLL